MHDQMHLLLYLQFCDESKKVGHGFDPSAHKNDQHNENMIITIKIDQLCASSNTLTVFCVTNLVRNCQNRTKVGHGFHIFLPRDTYFYLATHIFYRATSTFFTVRGHLNC